MLSRIGQTRRRLRAALTASAAALMGMATASAAYAADPDQSVDAIKTASPIKHVIIIVGENRSFDHVYATYKPKKGETVLNLLSEGIVNADGTPGPHFARGHQFQIVAPPNSGHYFISADAAQIEQVLINLVHNAVDASIETQGNVAIRWREAGDCVEVVVDAGATVPVRVGIGDAFKVGRWTPVEVLFSPSHAGPIRLEVDALDPEGSFVTYRSRPTESTRTSPE